MLRGSATLPPLDLHQRSRPLFLILTSFEVLCILHCQMSHQEDSPLIDSPATRHPGAGEGQSNLVSISDSRDILDDEFRRQLDTQWGHDTQEDDFRYIYAGFERRPAKQFFQSIVEYIVFQPPSTFQSFESTEEPDMRTFSQALNDLRAALRKDDPGCVRFW